MRGTERAGRARLPARRSVLRGLARIAIERHRPNSATEGLATSANLASCTFTSFIRVLQEICRFNLGGCQDCKLMPFLQNFIISRGQLPFAWPSWDDAFLFHALSLRLVLSGDHIYRENA
eukprot:2895137-Pleurochrysis_carterae.AAC.1